MGEHDDDLDVPTASEAAADADAIARALEHVAVAIERGFAELARALTARREPAATRRKVAP